jgi:hypothetical protein
MGGFGGHMGGFGGGHMGGFHQGGFGRFGGVGFFPGFYGSGFGYPYYGYGLGYGGYGLGYGGYGLGYGGYGYGYPGYGYGMGYSYPYYDYGYGYPYYGTGYAAPVGGYGYSSAYVAPGVGVASAVTAPVAGQGRYLGIVEEPVTEPGGKQGIKVANVYPGTPAEQAGLQAGDVIHSINGYLTEQRGNLAWIIANAAPGNVLKMNVRTVRDGQEHTITAQLP